MQKKRGRATFDTPSASDGKTYQVDYYNLDVILSVGYRVKSKRGIEFRRWANFRRLRLRGGFDPIGASLKDLGKKLFAFSRMGISADEVLP